MAIQTNESGSLKSLDASKVLIIPYKDPSKVSSDRVPSFLYDTCAITVSAAHVFAYTNLTFDFAPKIVYIESRAGTSTGASVSIRLKQGDAFTVDNGTSSAGNVFFSINPTGYYFKLEGDTLRIGWKGSTSDNKVYFQSDLFAIG